VYTVFTGDAIVDEHEQKTLWSEKWSFAALMSQRAKIGSIRFNRNYRSRIMSDEDSAFPMVYFTGGIAEDGTYYPGCFDSSLVLSPPLQDSLGRTLYRDRIMGVDPAIGITARSSYFGLFVIGLDMNNRVVILDIRRVRIGFVAQKRLVSRLYNRWHPRAIVVENNAYQRALIEGLQEDDIRLPVVSKATSMKDPITIPSMDVYFEMGRVRIPRGDTQSVDITDTFVEELNQWPNASTSDLLMAFYFALMRLMQYAPSLTELPNPENLVFGDAARAMNRLQGSTGRLMPGRTLRDIQQMVRGAPLKPVRDLPLHLVEGVPLPSRIKN